MLKGIFRNNHYMVDQTVYVDPFLQKGEREQFVGNFKQMQKKRVEANMVRTQHVFRGYAWSAIVSKAAECFQENRILVVVRAHGTVNDVVNLCVKGEHLVSWVFNRLY